MKRLYCLFIIILCLAISIPSYAQFTINGKHIIYDKQNDTYMACIPEDAFGKDYEAIILLDIASDWSDINAEVEKVFRILRGVGDEASHSELQTV